MRMGIRDYPYTVQTREPQWMGNGKGGKPQALGNRSPSGFRTVSAVLGIGSGWHMGYRARPLGVGLLGYATIWVVGAPIGFPWSFLGGNCMGLGGVGVTVPPHSPLGKKRKPFHSSLWCFSSCVESIFRLLQKRVTTVLIGYFGSEKSSKAGKRKNGLLGSI